MRHNSPVDINSFTINLNTFREHRVIGNFVFVVQRTDCPNYRLTVIDQYGQVEIIFRFQRPLIRDYRISVDYRRVQ